MEKIEFDYGVKEYAIGNGVLRFNPTDPNVYDRFQAAAEKIAQVEDELVARGKGADGAAVLRLVSEADRKVKDLLDEVFGCGNDFHSILGGVNVLAVCGNGERVITNLFEALKPILVEGAQRYAAAKVNAARELRAAQRKA